MKRFRSLPAAQADVFEQIAVNNDAGHHPATIKALLKKGLIEKSQVAVGRYYVPTAIHIEWCQWCSEQPHDEEDAP